MDLGDSVYSSVRNFLMTYFSPYLVLKLKRKLEVHLFEA